MFEDLHQRRADVRHPGFDQHFGKRRSAPPQSFTQRDEHGRACRLRNIGLGDGDQQLHCVFRSGGRSDEPGKFHQQRPDGRGLTAEQFDGKCSHVRMHGRQPRHPQIGIERRRVGEILQSGDRLPCVKLSECERPLPAQLRRRVGQQLGDLLRTFGAAHPFEQHDAVLLDPRVRVFQQSQHIGLVERLEPVQRPGRVQPRKGTDLRPALWKQRRRGDRPQRFDSGPVLAFNQHSLRGVADRAVRRIQIADQIHRGGPAEIRRRQQRPLHPRWLHAPDASLVVSALQIAQRLDVFGNRRRMLDRFAVHVEHVQRAVRRVDEIRRTEPVVGRREKLAVAFGSRGDKADAVGGQLLAMHQVSTDVTDEDCPLEFRGIGTATIDCDPRGRREEADRDEFRRWQPLGEFRVRRPPRRPDQPPRFGGALAINDGRGSLLRNGTNGARHGQLRVAFQIVQRPRHMHDVVAVRTDEPLAEIIDRVAELLSAGDHRDLVGGRVQTQVAASRCEFPLRLLADGRDGQIAACHAG